MKIKRFVTPLYGSVFFVIIYDTDQEIKDYLKRKKITLSVNPSYFDGGVFENENEGVFCLMLKSYVHKKKQYPTPGIIAHEAKHLVNAIFVDIGQELDLHNDEAECYLLGWIVDRVHELNKKHLNDKK